MPGKQVTLGRRLIVAGSDDDMLRLTAVIDHQRRELDRIRAAAAEESVVAMAWGALMERLGLSLAEAAGQLAELSAATGIPLAEMAAAVLSGALADSGAPEAGGSSDVAASGGVRVATVAAQPRSDTQSRSPSLSRSRSLLAETAAELAADGGELVSTLAAQVMDPLGAVADVCLHTAGSPQ